MKKYGYWGISLVLSLIGGGLIWLFFHASPASDPHGISRGFGSVLTVVWVCFHLFFHLFVVSPTKLKTPYWRFYHLRPFVNRNMLVFAVKMTGYLCVLGLITVLVMTIPSWELVTVTLFCICSIPVALFYIMAVSQLYQEP